MAEGTHAGGMAGDLQHIRLLDVGAFGSGLAGGGRVHVFLVEAGLVEVRGDDAEQHDAVRK